MIVEDASGVRLQNASDAHATVDALLRSLSLLKVDDDNDDDEPKVADVASQIEVSKVVFVS